ncbi:MAG: DUF998 domain-containing protein [Planctomycetes bacterium]|nr:DUF998 domain-containing protein [Planctomycetota bacterium]
MNSSTTTGTSVRQLTTRRALLVCGTLAAGWYVLMNIFVPLQWPEYSAAAQTVSELSAINAPTRGLWVALGVVYAVLLSAFALGTWSAAGESKALHVAAAAVGAQGILSTYWPPMQLRGAEMALTDVLHIVWAGATLLLMLVSIGFGAAALGRAFRVYSLATVVAFLAFGTLTAIDGPRIAANEQTPLIGAWERINIGAYMLWLAVFAAALLGRMKANSASSTSPQTHSAA